MTSRSVYIHQNDEQQIVILQNDTHLNVIGPKSIQWNNAQQIDNQQDYTHQNDSQQTGIKQNGIVKCF
jgi:hypothetical protein